jgi:hypothetical protein
MVNPGGADTSAETNCGPPSFVIVKLIVAAAPPVTVAGVKTALKPDDAAEPPEISIAATTAASPMTMDILWNVFHWFTIPSRVTGPHGRRMTTLAQAAASCQVGTDDLTPP